MAVTYTVADDVATVALDDGKANAISLEILAELNDALSRAEADRDVHALLIAGRPGRFSGGFDLATMTSGTDAMPELVVGGGRFMARLLTHPMPVVVACTGHALAAGALLLLAADVRIGAAGSWKIGLNEVAIGMALPRWAVELARYRMPPGEFDRIILGDVTAPDEAQRAGFLDRIVDASDVVSEATAAAVRLAGLRRGAVAGTKAKARAEAARRMLEDLDDDIASLTGPTPG